MTVAARGEPEGAGQAAGGEDRPGEGDSRAAVRQVTRPQRFPTNPVKDTI
jgi:hypothetical protein